MIRMRLDIWRDAGRRTSNEEGFVARFATANLHKRWPMDGYPPRKAMKRMCSSQLDATLMVIEMYQMVLQSLV